MRNSDAEVNDVTVWRNLNRSFVHNEKRRKDRRKSNGTKKGYGNGGKHINPGYEK